MTTGESEKVLFFALRESTVAFKMSAACSDVDEPLSFLVLPGGKDLACLWMARADYRMGRAPQVQFYYHLVCGQVSVNQLS